VKWIWWERGLIW